MKISLLLVSACLLCLIHLSAQQLEKAKEHLKANKLIEAKAAIDAVLKDAANQKNADAWYTKAKIYNAITLDDQTSKLFPMARMDAFTALKKYTETDKSLAALKVDGFKPINDIYTAWYHSAANSFNAQQYNLALESFANAVRVSSFMNEKGWINLQLDTNSVLYAGVSAEKLNRRDDAVKYYSQLVNAKAKREGFVEIYKWVANYYYEKKNAAEAMKYLLLGREVYPADPFWNSLELDLARDKGNKETLFAQYEKTIAADPRNHLYPYNYAVELYQLAYNLDTAKRPPNSEALIQKAMMELNRALQLKPEYSKAQLFAGQIHYNLGVDLLNKQKASKSASSNDFKTKAIAQFDEALPYFLAVEQLLTPQGKLKPEDKKDLKEAFDLLTTIYNQKGLKNKMKEYEAKFNEAETKH